MDIVIDHELKTFPKPFEETWARNKKYEIRSSDREFENGEAVLLREWDPRTGRYTGREIITEITCVTRGGTWGLPRNLHVFSHREISRRKVRF